MSSFVHDDDDDDDDDDNNNNNNNNNNNDNNHDDIYSAVISRATARVHSVHAMNTETAADFWTK